MAQQLLRRSRGRAQRLSASSESVWHLAETPFKRLRLLDFVRFAAAGSGGAAGLCRFMRILIILLAIIIVI